MVAITATLEAIRVLKVYKYGLKQDSITAKPYRLRAMFTGGLGTSDRA
jgi:hypothetical protein